MRNTRSRKRGLLLTVLAVAGALALAACAAGPNPQAGNGQAGFWTGLWQGLILPITFIVSLFTDHVTIYEVRNDGNWYDFGYVLGVMLVFSGGGVGARGRR